MITDQERAALAEGSRRAAANGHELEPPREGSSIVTLSCRHCSADVALLKGDAALRLSGLALSRPCSGAVSDESLAEVAPCTA